MVPAFTYWVVISVLLHNVFACMAWILSPVSRSQPAALWLEQRAAHRWLERVWPGLREIGRFLFCIGIPYLALLRGVVSPRVMGLHDAPTAATALSEPLTLVAGVLTLDWARSLGAGSLLALGAFGTLALIWWRYQRLVGKLPTRSWRFRGPEAENEASPAPRWPLTASIAAVRQPWGWARLLLEAVYLQTHWAFYRAWTLDLLRDDPAGPTMGAFLGLVLVGLEWYGDVGLRARMRTLAGVEEWVFVASLAFVTTFIFLFIGNLWALIAIHWLVAWGLLAFLEWLRHRSMTRVQTT